MKKVFLIILMLTIFATSIPVNAANVEFEGWNEKTKEDAWLAYATTDWREFGESLMFGELKSGNNAINISIMVRSYKDDIEKVLEGLDASYGRFKNKNYTNLIMAIMQVLSNGFPDPKDPCCVCTYIKPNMYKDKMTPEKSIEILFKEIDTCENAYQGEFSIYENNAALQTVVQGIVFGKDYTSTTKEYSEKNAQKYLEEHKDKIKSDEAKANFAKDVSSHYNAHSVNGIYAGSGEATVGMKIVDAARTQLGVPYVWGGTKPGVGLDCSGLTQYAHKMAGITIPRTSGPQGNGGKKIPSQAEAMPGDIVCYEGHVGIYIGGGQMIHAPQPGDVVKVQKVYGSPWYRRYW